MSDEVWVALAVSRGLLVPVLLGVCEPDGVAVSDALCVSDVEIVWLALCVLLADSVCVDVDVSLPVCV